MEFSSIDFAQINEHRVSLKNIEEQLNFFKNGIAKADLVETATLQNGILKLSNDEFEEKASLFDSKKSNVKLEKFVPASGAASRMFKFLNEFLNDFDIEKESIDSFITRKNDTELAIFIAGINKFPFYEIVNTELKKLYPGFESLSTDYKNYYFIKTLIGADFYDYANKPKGILPFHKYENHIATAIEEHLNECTLYSSSNGVSNLHFTVSETHQKLFENIIAEVKSRVETASGIAININFSFQNKNTDTIAVDTDNNPFREDGKLVFRPGGHGALIENLNALESDIVFIKNIDNVIQNESESIALNKKALAGVLLELQEENFNNLNKIDNATEAELNDILFFAKEKLNLKIAEDFTNYTLSNKIDYLKTILNRPIRVCGMVKNEGEAGGGPFWVRDSNGFISLQIVESSQVDLQNPIQANILKQSTHFNPVDLVCGIRNYKNEKFNLTEYTDPNSGFIVEKNKNGHTVKSYELPGLWNGAMANWISLFVEVPLITFNPVKTVNDLLKPAHQP